MNLIFYNQSEGFQTQYQQLDPENTIIHRFGYCPEDLSQTKFTWDQIDRIYVDDLRILNRFKRRNIIDIPVYLNGILQEEYIPPKRRNYRSIVFNVRVRGNYVLLDVLHKGHIITRQEVTVLTNEGCDIKPIKSSAWRNYSSVARHFKQNFVTYRIKISTLESIKFMIGDREANVIWKHAYFENTVRISPQKQLLFADRKMELNIVEFPDDVMQARLFKRDNPKPIYLFSDRPDKADDNAEALYKYYTKTYPEKADYYFIIEQSSPDFKRLQAEGVNVIAFGSMQHKILYYAAELIFCSHMLRRFYAPIDPEYFFLTDAKFIFLQHGVIFHDHSNLIHRSRDSFDLILASSPREVEILEQYSQLNNIALTGLPRFDNLTKQKQNDSRTIIYTPSWNRQAREDFDNSEYGQELFKVLQSKELNSVLKRHNITLKLILHPLMTDYKLLANCTNENINITNGNNIHYQTELINANAMITDYSSVQFDFLYMRKPVISFQPYDSDRTVDLMRIHKQAMYQADNTSQLVNIIEKLVDNDFTQTSKQLEVTNTVFAYPNDGLCCERVVKAADSLTNA